MRAFQTITILIAALSLSACAGFRNMVCDCEKKVSTCNEPMADDGSPIIQVSRENQENGDSGEFVAPIPGEGAKLDPIDPADKSADVDLGKDEAKVKRALGKVPVAAFRGDFGGKRGSEYVGIDDDSVIFANGSWKAELPVDEVVKPDEIPETTVVPFAGKLVNDDEFELVAFVAETNNPAQRVYRVHVYKSIGDRLALVFNHVFGVKTAEGYTQVARIDFVEGPHHKRIRVTPITDDGLLDLPNVQLYVWNRWEGMFRVPKRAPTAPR